MNIDFISDVLNYVRYINNHDLFLSVTLNQFAYLDFEVRFSKDCQFPTFLWDVYAINTKDK